MICVKDRFIYYLHCPLCRLGDDEKFNPKTVSPATEVGTRRLLSFALNISHLLSLGLCPVMLNESRGVLLV